MWLKMFGGRIPHVSSVDENKFVETSQWIRLWTWIEHSTGSIVTGTSSGTCAMLLVKISKESSDCITCDLMGLSGIPCLSKPVSFLSIMIWSGSPLTQTKFLHHFDSLLITVVRHSMYPYAHTPVHRSHSCPFSRCLPELRLRVELFMHLLFLCCLPVGAETPAGCMLFCTNKLRLLLLADTACSCTECQRVIICTWVTKEEAWECRWKSKTQRQEQVGR